MAGKSALHVFFYSFFFHSFLGCLKRIGLEPVKTNIPRRHTRFVLAWKMHKVSTEWARAYTNVWFWNFWATTRIAMPCKIMTSCELEIIPRINRKHGIARNQVTDQKWQCGVSGVAAWYICYCSWTTRHLDLRFSPYFPSSSGWFLYQAIVLQV